MKRALKGAATLAALTIAMGLAAPAAFGQVGTPGASPSVEPSEPPTETPTLTPTPTDTPTPTPTGEPVVIWDFETGDQNWRNIGGGGPLTPPTFEAVGGQLRIITDSNDRQFGVWDSPDDEPVTIDPDALYWATFEVKTDIVPVAEVPGLRVRANATNYQQANFVEVPSTGDGANSPVPAGKSYHLFLQTDIDPADAGWRFSFDMVNFDENDATSGYLALESLVVESIPIPGPGTDVQLYDFEGTTHDWNFATLPGVFAEPTSPVTAAEIGLGATDNTNLFGFWHSPDGNFGGDPDVTLGDEMLYRMTFSVRSDQDDTAALPTIRLRVNADDFQSASYLRLDSNGDGGNSPGTTVADYVLYYLSPASSNGAGLVFSFDMINFNSDDSASAEVYLDNLLVETVDLP